MSGKKEKINFKNSSNQEEVVNQISSQEVIPPPASLSAKIKESPADFFTTLKQEKKAIISTLEKNLSRAETEKHNQKNEAAETITTQKTADTQDFEKSLDNCRYRLSALMSLFTKIDKDIDSFFSQTAPATSNKRDLINDIKHAGKLLSELYHLKNRLPSEKDAINLLNQNLDLEINKRAASLGFSDFNSLDSYLADLDQQIYHNELKPSAPLIKRLTSSNLRSQHSRHKEIIKSQKEEINLLVKAKKRLLDPIIEIKNRTSIGLQNKLEALNALIDPKEEQLEKFLCEKINSWSLAKINQLNKIDIAEDESGLNTVLNHIDAVSYNLSIEAEIADLENVVAQLFPRQYFYNKRDRGDSIREKISKAIDRTPLKYFEQLSQNKDFPNQSKLVSLLRDVCLKDIRCRPLNRLSSTSAAFKIFYLSDYNTVGAAVLNFYASTADYHLPASSPRLISFNTDKITDPNLKIIAEHIKTAGPNLNLTWGQEAEPFKSHLFDFISAKASDSNDPDRYLAIQTLIHRFASFYKNQAESIKILSKIWTNINDPQNFANQILTKVFSTSHNPDIYVLPELEHLLNQVLQHASPSLIHDRLIELLDILMSINKLDSEPFLQTITDKLQSLTHHDFSLFSPDELQNLFIKTSGHPDIQRIIIANIDKFSHIQPDKRETYLSLWLEIDNSISQEIQTLKFKLMPQLLEVADPLQAYRQIESVFIKNNLPLVGKIFKIFQILYPPRRFKQMISANDYLSPVLMKSGAHRREKIIYQDLVNIHLRSGNRSFYRYLSILKQGQGILDKLSQQPVESLSPSDKNQLHHFLNKIEALLLNSSLGRNYQEVDSTASLADRYKALKRSLSVKPNQSINERIAEMFLHPVGVKNLDAALALIETSRAAAHKRNQHNYAYKNGKLILAIAPGDLLKGIEDKYLSDILQNGSVSKEFLGPATDSDATPFDTDLSLILPTDIKANNLPETIDKSLASSYGRLLLLVKDRGQFIKTRDNTRHLDISRAKTLSTKPELFFSGFLNERHYGVRTGFAATEIDALILNYDFSSSELDSLFFAIAKNGFYIPVATKTGEVIFTPDIFHKYQQVFAGLKEFNDTPLETKPLADSLKEHPEANLSYKNFLSLVKQKQEDLDSLNQISSSIKNALSQLLAKLNVAIKDKFDQSLLGAELVDIGSTGRNTNIPGSYDFDLSLRLDSKDFTRASEIFTLITANITSVSSQHHIEASRHYYQIRAFGVTKLGNQDFEKPIDIDIGLNRRSEKLEFSSHDAINEKLAWIKDNQGETAYQNTVANIVLAKQLLKEGSAYKKLEHGSLGGVGIENWILQNKGNLIEAFKTFYEASHDDQGEIIPLKKFKSNYPIFDAGLNLKTNAHDNFINKLTEDGYQAILNVITAYLPPKT